MSRLGPILLLLLPLAMMACVDDWAKLAQETEAEAPESGEREGRPSEKLGAAFFAGYEAEIEQALQELQVPGLAVGIVSEDDVLYAKGFGLRHERRNRPVTENTLFRVGSLTTVLTVTMLATLVDEDRLEWGRPLRVGEEHLDTRLRELLNRDLSVAGHEVLEQGVGVEEVMTSSGGPRESFAALSYAALGSAGETRRPGPAYHRLMHAKLFGPAGMTRTAVGGRLSAMGSDFAAPYSVDSEGRTVEIDSFGSEAYVPVDGTVSTVSDLAGFAMLHLRDGISPSQKRVVSPANLSRSKGTPGEGSPCSEWLRSETCRRALGWQVREMADGEVLWVYEGGASGYSAMIAYLEKRRLAWVLLNNKEPELGGAELNGQATDLLLARLADVPWDPGSRLERFRRKIDTVRNLASRVQPVRASEVRPYLGIYEGGWVLSFDQQDLRLLNEMHTFPVASGQAGELIIPSGPGRGTEIRFQRGSDGRLEMAMTSFDGPQTRSFRKIG